MGLLTAPTVKKLNLNFTNPRWQTAAILKTDFDFKVHMCGVEMASRKIQTYQNKAKNLCTIFCV